MNKEVQLLYRKVNRNGYQAHMCEQRKIHYRWERHTKKTKQEAMDGVQKMPMKLSKRKYNGFDYDYTPLFHYLLKQVGGVWDNIYSNIIQRLNTIEPIFWMVDVNGLNNSNEYFKVGEATYFSKLYVNEDGILCKVNPNLNSIPPSCNCHTHSFNGKVISNKNYKK